MKKTSYLLTLLFICAYSLLLKAQKSTLLSIKLGTYYPPQVSIGFNYNYFDYLTEESSQVGKPLRLELLATRHLKKRHELQLGISYQAMPLQVNSFICGIVPPCEPFHQHYYLQFLGLNVHHGYQLLHAKRLSLSCYNGIQPTYSFDAYDDKGNLRKFSLCLKSELTFAFTFDKGLGFSISPYCTQFVTGLNKDETFLPFSFGAMVGFFLNGD